MNAKKHIHIKRTQREINKLYKSLAYIIDPMLIESINERIGIERRVLGNQRYAKTLGELYCVTPFNRI